MGVDGCIDEWMDGWIKASTSTKQTFCVEDSEGHS